MFFYYVAFNNGFNAVLATCTVCAAAVYLKNVFLSSFIIVIIIHYFYSERIMRVIRFPGIGKWEHTTVQHAIWVIVYIDNIMPDNKTGYAYQSIDRDLIHVL